MKRGELTLTKSIKRKGIVLAGGRGTRLYPLTLTVSKQLLPIYDKPLIYYPLSVLMLADLRDILIISNPETLSLFQTLLGDGRELGLNLSYAVQDKPRGVAEALLIAESFLNSSSLILILGDNIFFGHGLSELLHKASVQENGAGIFAYPVKDPKRYGVIAFDERGKPINIIEKPEHPPSPYAVTGIYFYDDQATSLARTLKPSKRGELEITDLNRLYLEQGHLHVYYLGRGSAWLDAGTPDFLLEASQLVATIEKRQGLKIACLEEIAWRKGWIDDEAVLRLSERFEPSDYATYLKQLITQG